MTESPNGANDENTIRRAVEFAESGARAAGEGRKEDARAQIRAALDLAPDDLRVLFLAFQFHFRAGEYDEAERHVRRRMALAAPESEDLARACTNLGLVLFYKRDLDAAEREMKRAVEISTRLGNRESMARDIGNLALIYEDRGELDRAEAMFREGLALAESVGAEKIVSGKLANLGDIAMARGDSAAARELWSRGLAIMERLGLTMWREELRKKLEGVRER